MSSADVARHETSSNHVTAFDTKEAAEAVTTSLVYSRKCLLVDPHSHITGSSASGSLVVARVDKSLILCFCIMRRLTESVARLSNNVESAVV